tara:strand:- start:6342 stop:7652 length:1311 start_codon:yes stop_codon:yes gene_type:complete
MIPPIASVTCIVILIAAIVTISVCIMNLRSRWPHRVPYRWIGGLSLLRSIMTGVVFLVAAIAMPHPVIIAALFMLAALLFLAIRWRSKEEASSLNDVIRLVAMRRGAIPEAVEAFARGRGGRVAVRAAHFAYRLQCGESVETAVRRTRVPVTADSILSIQANTAGTPFVEAARPGTASCRLFSTTATGELPWRTGPGWLRVHTRPQLAYLMYLIAFSLLLGWFFRSWVLPTLEQISQEFGVRFDRHSPWLASFVDASGQLTVGICILALLWLCLVVASRLFPVQWILRLTPWYGDCLGTQHRAVGLSSLAHGVDRGQPVAKILDTAAQNSNSRWIRWRSRAAVKRIARGEPLSEALRQSGWLTATEQPWIEASEKNGQLALAFQQLADDTVRRFELRWQVRLAWLVPVTILAAGTFVLAHSYCLFAQLLGFVHVLS